MNMEHKLPMPPPHKDGRKEPPSRIINEISRLFAAKMRESESEMTQESVRLIIICLAHGDGITQLDLVKKTHLSPPTVSITVKKLEDLGYISRVSDNEDGRAVRVYLTDKGRQLDDSTRDAVHNVNNILMQGITPEQTEILTQLLGHMRDNLLHHLMSEGENTQK